MLKGGFKQQFCLLEEGGSNFCQLHELWAGCDGAKSLPSPWREGAAGQFGEIWLFLARDLLAKEKGGAIPQLLMRDRFGPHYGDANQNEQELHDRGSMSWPCTGCLLQLFAQRSGFSTESAVFLAKPLR